MPPLVTDSTAGPSAAATAAGSGSAATLPWMRVPVSIEPGSGVALHAVVGLDPRLLESLSSPGLGYTELFPVQAAMWRQLAGGCSTAHDMCVAAPTGSGKTLAYALPIVQALQRPVGSAGRHRLRALVVLPTRDLAVQVHALFSVLCAAVGLKAGLAAAKASQAEEARALVGAASDRGRGVDVLVATPGRLTAHLQDTPGFTLGDLRFLVADEADRLMRQSYQQWLPHVLQALPLGDAPPSCAPGACGPSLMGSNTRVVKVVVSATLTRDPSKLLRLVLCAPRFLALASAAPQRYQLPRSLSEWQVPAKAHQKPLALLVLLARLQGRRVLVFASSLDMTHRLCLMLAAVPALAPQVLEYSAALGPRQRSANLDAFRAAAAGARVLVASDAATRGMDLPDVAAVVNYDAPAHAKLYVHRAGRTARAGKPGEVYTLLRPEDMRHFKALLRKLDNNVVRRIDLSTQELQEHRPALRAALAEVQALLDLEAGGEGPAGGGTGADAV